MCFFSMVVVEYANWSVILPQHSVPHSFIFRVMSGSCIEAPKTDTTCQTHWSYLLHVQHVSCLSLEIQTPNMSLTFNGSKSVQVIPSQFRCDVDFPEFGCLKVWTIRMLFILCSSVLLALPPYPVTLFLGIVHSMVTNGASFAFVNTAKHIDLCKRKGGHITGTH